MKSFAVIISIIGLSIISGCVPKSQMASQQKDPVPTPVTAVGQIDSFQPETACRQAVEVVSRSPYSQGHFEQVFERVVAQIRESSREDNADIVWDHFVTPLKQGGKVPPDLAVYLWNCYFSKQFVSLPDDAPLVRQCYRLSEVKKNIEKEYPLKRAGFKVSRQGDADTHFLNAMYVYNTMWAACTADRR